MGAGKLAKKFIKQALINRNNNRYEKALRDRQISYHQWITDLESEYQSGEEEDFAKRVVLLCNPRGRVARNAKKWILDCFAEHPEAVLLYGDEDVWAGDERTSPYFKPDWSPDLLETRFYMGSLVAVRRDWLEQQKETGTVGCPDGKTEDCRMEVLRLVRLAGGYEKGRGRRTIVHIPRILFHCDSEADREQWICRVQNLDGTDFVQDSSGTAFLSVIIPSKDNPDMLRKCVNSVLAAAGDLQYEMIVVDNGSAPDNKKKIKEFLEQIRQEGSPGMQKVIYRYEPMDFNFSKMCNLGAEKASGELLMFLNDDVELVLPDSLKVMAKLAAKSYVGAVGLKLLYPEDKARVRIQHTGITNLPMGPVHKLQFCQDEQEYYFGWNRGRHNVLAVTAACLMVEKRKFQETGGFDESLAVAFNDVELCFRLYEQGYENVCECDSYAFHDESYSRGDDEAPEKLARLLEERRKLYERHPALEGQDPYYSVWLNRQGLDTKIRPAYETEGNTVQLVKRGQLSRQRREKLESCRQDACLMVRVESVLENGRVITGWSAVLGDNNACYLKEMVLQNEDIYYTFPLEGQYRPDLAENMPDQTNVGLCGYMVEMTEGVLPGGRYRVGIVARNRVTGGSLINWSNRMVEI